GVGGVWEESAAHGGGLGGGRTRRGDAVGHSAGECVSQDAVACSGARRAVYRPPRHAHGRGSVWQWSTCWVGRGSSWISSAKRGSARWLPSSSRSTVFQASTRSPRVIFWPRWAWIRGGLLATHVQQRGPPHRGAVCPNGGWDFVGESNGLFHRPPHHPVLWSARPSHPGVDHVRAGPRPPAPAAGPRCRPQTGRRPAPLGRGSGDGEEARLGRRCEYRSDERSFLDGVDL